LLPHASLTVIDGNAANIEIARQRLTKNVAFLHAWFDPARHQGFDLVILPLAFVGDREACYRRPPAPALIVHDWLWHRREQSVLVSLFLLKRLNLVRK
jgi:hypothetical protein